MLVLRVSESIEADLARNYSTIVPSWKAADSVDEYKADVMRRLEIDPDFGELEMQVVEIDEGVYGLKHHDWLAATKIPVSREEFLALTDDEKEAMCDENSWGSIVGFSEEGVSFVSFDGSNAELVWSDGTFHVFETDSTETETGVTWNFLNAFED